MLWVQIATWIATGSAAPTPGTVGTLFPGVEALICDPETLRPVAEGHRGELLVRGPNVMAGYHEDEAATARAITSDGWLRTGDLATRDADGNLHIVGRSKDIIIRGGENIAPAEIENLLREHPDVVDAAVVGVPSSRLGEEVGAVLILRAGATLDADDQRRRLKDRLASFKIPEHWMTVEAFPLTGSGKVQKYRLRERFQKSAGG